MNTKQRRVNYERSILTYIDILGFREMIATKTAGDISRSIRVVREAVAPHRFKTSIPEIPEADFRNFSDLYIIRKPIAKEDKFPASGEVHSQILHMVHVQSTSSSMRAFSCVAASQSPMCPQLWPAVGPAVIRGYAFEPGRPVSAHRRRHRSSQGTEEEPGAWVHDGDTDIKATKSLLRRDFDGEYFVDYLRGIEEELDERSEFPGVLEQHQEFIKRGLTRYKDDQSILPKYKWLREYHRYTVKRWKERNSAE